MLRLIPGCAAALLLAACATGGAGAPPAPYPSSEFTPGPDGTVGRERIVNRTLRRVTLDEGRTPMLLVIDHAWWNDPAAEEDEGGGTVKVAALGWDGAAFSRPLWTVDEHADDWRTEWTDYLRLTENGCCDLDQTHTYHDLRTGRLVAWSTDEPLTAYDRDGRSVLVAFESPRSTRVPDGFTGEGVQGMLRIVRGAEVTDSVVLTGGGEGEAGYVLGRGVFCGADGAVLLRAPDGMGDDRTFYVCYPFESGAWAVLPVRGGGFVLEGARFPAGIAARRGGW